MKHAKQFSINNAVIFAAKFLLLAVCILFLTGTSYSQLFLKSYDFPPFGTRTEYGYSIERNFDGTLAGRWSIAGVSNSTPNAGSFDWMFLKLTNTGTVSCARLLGFTLADSCYSHIQFSAGDKRNVLAGFYRAPNGREKASFSLLDTNCIHIGSRQILDSLRHEYRQVVKNPTDVFTLAGYIETYIPGSTSKNHILASQYSPAGALMWAFNYIPPFPWVDEKAHSICYQPTDGSYAITGITNRFTGPTGPYQVFVMKVSPAGIPIWFKGYSPMPGAPSEGRKIIAMPDGGFVITGSSPAYDPASDIYVLRISSTGTPIWSNTYGMPGASERSYSIIYKSSDLSLIFTGGAMLPGATEDIILTKISAAAGAHFWTKRYPSTSGVDKGYDLKEATVPAGFGVTGRLYNPASTSDDPFLLKSDAFGIVSSACQDSLTFQPRPGLWNDSCQRNIVQLTDITIQPQVTNPTVTERSICGTTTGISTGNEIANEFTLKQNYPNPFNPSTIIEFSVPSAGDVSLTVYDAAGKQVALLVSGHKERGNYAVQFSALNLSSGIYFYKLKSEGFEQTKKMLMVK
jgi:hypothetical protein